MKSRHIGKDPEARKEIREDKGTTEDRVAGWYYQLKGHECEQTSGDGERQGNLACCSLWGHKKSEMTEGLTNNNIP